MPYDCIINWSSYFVMHPNVQTHKFGRLSGSSYPHIFLCRAAEAFTSAHITVGYLPRAADMLTIQIRAIDGRGTFTP